MGVHLPSCVHHADDDGFLRWQSRPQRERNGCYPSWLHLLRHHLQVWCWLPRLQDWSDQEHVGGRFEHEVHSCRRCSTHREWNLIIWMETLFPVFVTSRTCSS